MEEHEAPRDFRQLTEEAFRDSKELYVTPQGLKAQSHFKRIAHDSIHECFLRKQVFPFEAVCITNCEIDNRFLQDRFIPDCLPRLPSVTSLDLTFNKIGVGAAEALLQSLNQLPNLKGLYLDGNFLRSGGISHLHLTQLRRIGLRSCFVGDDGVQSLTANIFQQESPIVFLNLKDNDITDAGIRHLVNGAFVVPTAGPGGPQHNCRHMSRLNLSNNDLGDEAIAFLAVHGLEGLPVLEDLLLSSCNFGDMGMEHLARHLRNHGKLDWLDVCDNRIGNRGCQELSVRIPPKLTKIAIKGNDLIGDEGRERLAVAMFYTRRCERIWGISLCLYWDVLNLPATYESAKNHEVLEFSRMQERPRPGPILPEPERKGRHWELERRVVADLDAKVRSAMNAAGTGRLMFHLNNVDLYKLKQIPPEPILQRFNRVEFSMVNKIELRNCGIDSYWIHTFISNEGFHPCGNLRYLGLSRNSIENDGAAALVRELAIRCPRLRVLSLLGNNISNDGVVAMCEPDAGQLLTHLTKIDLSFNSIGDVGTMKIAHNLMPCLRKLQTLDLAFNEITSSGAEEFALYGLPNGAPLKHLYFNDNRIRKRGQLALAKAITTHQLDTIKTVWGVEFSMHWEELGLPESLKGARNFTILTFLRSTKDREKIRVSFSRVIVTGPGMVGKTCLIHWLITKTFPEAEPEMTDGIDITDYPVDDTMKLRFVDFGGQLIYQHTQRLFMDKKAVYLVLYHARTSLSDRDPLTKTRDIANGILTLWPGAKIIFVANKADEEVVIAHRDEVKRELRDGRNGSGGFNRNFAGWHSVSAKSGEGMFDLLHNIVAVAKDIQGTVEPVIMPVVSLSQAINEISNRPEHPLHITWSDFKAMAVARGFREDEDNLLKDILEMYQEWGLVLILPGAISLQRTFIIVKQQELANVLSAVISPKADVAQNLERGLLRHSEVAKIWEEYDPALHSGFLRLIHDIELGFHILLKDEAGKTVDMKATLIPAMLPHEEELSEEYEAQMRGQHPNLFKDPFHLRVNFAVDTLVRTIGARFLVRLRHLIVVNRWHRTGTELIYTDKNNGDVPLAYGRIQWNLDSDQPYLSLKSWGHPLLPTFVFSALNAVRAVHNRAMRILSYSYFCEGREFNMDEMEERIEGRENTTIMCRKCNRSFDVAWIKRLVEPFFHEPDDQTDDTGGVVLPQQEDANEAEGAFQFHPAPLTTRLEELDALLSDERTDAHTLEYRITAALGDLHRESCDSLSKLEGPKVTWLLFRDTREEHKYDHWDLHAIIPSPTGGFKLTDKPAKMRIINPRVVFRRSTGMDDPSMFVKHDPLSVLCGKILSRMGVAAPANMEYLGVFRQALAEGVKHRVRDLARHYFMKTILPGHHRAIWVLTEDSLGWYELAAQTGSGPALDRLWGQIHREIMPRTPLILCQREARILRQALNRATAEESVNVPSGGADLASGTGPFYLYFVCPITRKIALTNGGRGFKFKIVKRSLSTEARRALGIFIKVSMRTVASIVTLGGVEEQLESSLRHDYPRLTGSEAMVSSLRDLIGSAPEGDTPPPSEDDGATTRASDRPSVSLAAVSALAQDDAGEEERKGSEDDGTSKEDEDEENKEDPGEAPRFDSQQLRVTGNVPYLDDELHRVIMVNIVGPALLTTSLGDLSARRSLEKFGLVKRVYPNGDMLWVHPSIEHDSGAWDDLRGSEDAHAAAFVAAYNRVVDRRRNKRVSFRGNDPEFSYGS